MDDHAGNSDMVEDGISEEGFLSSNSGRGRGLTCSFPECTLQTVFTRKSDLKSVGIAFPGNCPC